MRTKRTSGPWDGDPDTLRQTDADMTSNDTPRLKVLGAPKSPLCERCGRRPAALVVVGELEGIAVRICRSCRKTRRFPMSLAPRSRRRRS